MFPCSLLQPHANTDCGSKTSSTCELKVETPFVAPIPASTNLDAETQIKIVTGIKTNSTTSIKVPVAGYIHKIVSVVISFEKQANLGIVIKYDMHFRCDCNVPMNSKVH